MVSVRFLVPPSWLNVARITGSRAEEGRWLGRQEPASASGLRSSRGREAGGYVSQQRDGGRGKKERRAFARLMTGHLQVGRSGAIMKGGHRGHPCACSDFAASPLRRRDHAPAPPIDASTNGKTRCLAGARQGRPTDPEGRPRLSLSQQASVGTDEHFAESA